MTIGVPEWTDSSMMNDSPKMWNSGNTTSDLSSSFKGLALVQRL